VGGLSLLSYCRSQERGDSTREKKLLTRNRGDGFVPEEAAACSKKSGTIVFFGSSGLINKKLLREFQDARRNSLGGIERDHQCGGSVINPGDRQSSGGRSWRPKRIHMTAHRREKRLWSGGGEAFRPQENSLIWFFPPKRVHLEEMPLLVLNPHPRTTGRINLADLAGSHQNRRALSIGNLGGNWLAFLGILFRNPATAKFFGRGALRGKDSHRRRKGIRF